MAEALSGFKILDLSRLLPGPFCSMLLADMGAEVIKIEEPKVGGLHPLVVSKGRQKQWFSCGLESE